MPHIWRNWKIFPNWREFIQRRVSIHEPTTDYMDFNKNLDGLPSEMCVNTEWGGFGDDGTLNDFLTPYDKLLDENSINPGRQRFEKTISGMYMVLFSFFVIKE